jgi:HEAT repeat protein
MDTPTSQAEPEPQFIPLDMCLSQLMAGTYSVEQLPTFSDLSRLQMRQVGRSWLSIPPVRRREVIEGAIANSESEVDLDFRRLLRVALTDLSPDIRQLAIGGLWEDDSRSLLEEMLQISVEDPSDDVKAAAIGFLTDAVHGQIEEETNEDLVAAFASLVTTLSDAAGVSGLVRARAIEAVGAVPQTIETRALINAAWEHGDSALAVAALLAIGRSHESRWLPLVRPEMQSDDPEIRFGAMRALETIGTSDDVEEIAALVIDEDPDVRLAAIQALGEIAGPGAVRILRTRAKTAPEDEQCAITNALDVALLMAEGRT